VYNSRYFVNTFDYQAASKGDVEDIPCSNIPIHCSMCPLSPEGKQWTIWKYNAPMHILLDHEQYDPDDTDLLMLPDIPMSMQVKMHISRAEETACGIKEKFAMRARADFKLLNSDDLPLDISEHGTDSESIETYDKNGGFIGKRQRAETQSTLKPPYKKLHF
jgi:hypothetical protein